MKVIHLPGHTYSFDEIRKGHFPSLSDYFRQSMEFCRDWLNQQKEFAIHTSGSTGTPKSIVVSREQMTASAWMTAEALGLKEGDKSLVCLNTELIAGKMMLVRGLETQMEITLVSPSSNPLKEFSDDTIFDFIALVPYQLETILKDSPEKKKILDRMKAILLGGAPVTNNLEDKADSIKAPVYHTFGMTETVSHIALRRLNGKEKSSGYQLLSNLKISIDSRNCLVIHSPFTKAPLITNDVIEIIDALHFKWLGRIDHVVNSGGIKIHPEKLELVIGRILITLKEERRFFVTGIPHEELGEIVGLIVEGPAWTTIKESAVKEEMIKHLSRYEVPKNIFFENIFPETASGKIDRIKTRQICLNKKA